jgi:hypothetical protein
MKSKIWTGFQENKISSSPSVLVVSELKELSQHSGYF